MKEWWWEFLQSSTVKEVDIKNIYTATKVKETYMASFSGYKEHKAEEKELCRTVHYLYHLTLGKILSYLVKVLIRPQSLPSRRWCTLPVPCNTYPYSRCYSEYFADGFVITMRCTVSLIPYVFFLGDQRFSPERVKCWTEVVLCVYKLCLIWKLRQISCPYPPLDRYTDLCSVADCAPNYLSGRVNRVHKRRTPSIFSDTVYIS